jgi:CRP-like cAMP-binding protein
VTQTAVCNARHTVPQRLARWLLEALDRTDGATVPLTHDFLGMMLGTRRAGVTVALGALSDAGLLRLGRWQIDIVDVKGVNAIACDCHSIVGAEYERLLG